jgi:hypothetical protein
MEGALAAHARTTPGRARSERGGNIRKGKFEISKPQIEISNLLSQFEISNLPSRIEMVDLPSQISHLNLLSHFEISNSPSQF